MWWGGKPSRERIGPREKAGNSMKFCNDRCKTAHEHSLLIAHDI